MLDDDPIEIKKTMIRLGRRMCYKELRKLLPDDDAFRMLFPEYFDQHGELLDPETVEVRW